MAILKRRILQSILKHIQNVEYTFFNTYAHDIICTEMGAGPLIIVALFQSMTNIQLLWEIAKQRN